MRRYLNEIIGISLAFELVYKFNTELFMFKLLYKNKKMLNVCI